MKSKKQFFRKTAGTIVLGIMVMLFAACTKEPSKTEIIHLGDIPEEYLATVPYQNGDVVKMMHESHRQIINYHVSMGHFSSLDEPSGWYGSPVYDYQVYWITLKPDYPTFEMELFLSNEYMRSLLSRKNGSRVL